MACQIVANYQPIKMFKLCVFVALLSLAAAAPAPAPVPAPAPSPSLLGPTLVGPGIWGPVVAPPVAIAPRIVQVVPGAVSHVSVSQLHPSPILLKSIW
ncbi:PREDICTED: neuropeptide-like 3 [Drosophila arizonae]|uniref:Neuropeptide-like 3 n=1 Tax=Drosophila arizonae TaxID=7263 RepID=A0ABM1PAG9_DROAR|nr:PREDICTED: neuropeptide-like 3 [Drosophila arizonae]